MSLNKISAKSNLATSQIKLSNFYDHKIVVKLCDDYNLI